MNKQLLAFLTPFLLSSPHRPPPSHHVIFHLGDVIVLAVSSAAYCHDLRKMVLSISLDRANLDAEELKEKIKELISSKNDTNRIFFAAFFSLELPKFRFCFILVSNKPSHLCFSIPLVCFRFFCCVFSPFSFCFVRLTPFCSKFFISFFWRPFVSFQVVKKISLFFPSYFVLFAFIFSCDDFFLANSVFFSFNFFSVLNSFLCLFFRSTPH